MTASLAASLSMCSRLSPQESPRPLSSGGSTSLFVEPSALTLSGDSEGDAWAEASYGVHCLLHSDGAVESVTVSTLHNDTLSHEDEVLEVRRPVLLLIVRCSSGVQ
jgi:hypothetical protein